MGKPIQPVNMCKSETWPEMFDNIVVLNKILRETISDFVGNERIISIEIRERNGLSRFWIYSQKGI